MGPPTVPQAERSGKDTRLRAESASEGNPPLVRHPLFPEPSPSSDQRGWTRGPFALLKTTFLLQTPPGFSGGRAGVSAYTGCLHRMGSWWERGLEVEM